MPQRAFITIHSETSNEEVDLELPGDQRIGDLLPDLLKVLNWPTSNGQKSIKYQFKTEQGQILDIAKSFQEQGIENFDVLWISLVEEQAPRTRNTSPLAEPGQSHENRPVRGFESLVSVESSPQDRRGSLTPPIWSRIPIDAPSLINLEKGLIFELGTLPVTIGRRSRDSHPDIDLSEIDPNFLVSRNHAQIVESPGGMSIKPKKTKNGTFLNGAELDPEETYLLKDGDLIQIGFRGVQVIFRT